MARRSRVAAEAPVPEAVPTTSPAAGTAAAPEPRLATRDRILEVALDLFIRRGYAATSMREIAEPLGISKAALYYHFPSKGHIMLELHLQMHRAFADMRDIPSPGANHAVWLRFVDQLIGLALRNRRLIEFHFRNRELFEGEASAEAKLIAEHEQAHEGDPFETELLALFLDRSGTPEWRLRRLASMGVVAAMLFGSAALDDIPDSELEPMVRKIARSVLTTR